MRTSQQLIQDRIKELRENTDFVNSLLESLVGYAIIAADFDGNIIAYNQGAYQIYGYAPEEVIGKQTIEIFFPRDFIEAGKLQEIIDYLIEKGRFSYEGEKVRKNRERFPAQILFTLTKDKFSKVVGFIEIVADLSERKKAEVRLKESESKFRAIFDNMTDGMAIADPDTKKLIMGNRAFCRMLGYSQKEIQNLGIADIHPEEDLPFVMQEFEKQLRGKIDIIPKLPVKRKDGSIFYADVYSIGILIANKQETKDK